MATQKVFGPIWCIVPVKSMAQSKTRLKPMAQEKRERLAMTMARDVINAAVEANSLDHVLVVTSDAAIERYAESVGAQVIEDPGQGLNAAIAEGLAFASEDGAGLACIVHADLPLVSAQELSRIVDDFCAAGETDAVGALVCKDNDGTNLLILDPSDPIELRFGKNSYALHKKETLKCERRFVELESDFLSLDIDTQKDIEQAIAELKGKTVSADTKSVLTSVYDTTSKSASAGLRQRKLEPDTSFSRDLEDLCAQASDIRDAGFGALVTYSPKVFLPTTYLCRDTCHYCVFAKTPRQVNGSLYMSEEETLRIARRGAALGCSEALFTLGEKPELRYSAARKWLDENGYESTLHYVAYLAERVLSETGLLPHINAGCMTEDEVAMLRPVSASMGLMLENVSPRLCEKGGPHYGSPDKDPAVRLQTIENAGKANVPFTTGILIGIGETRDEILDSLYAIRDLHKTYGHIQEIIIQNFVPKDATKMAETPAAGIDDLRWTIAAARHIFGPEMSLQAPPNLNEGYLEALIGAGINDWGGVSPLTPDHVNPESPWPHLDELRSATKTAGKHLQERLTVYPAYAMDQDIWIDEKVRPSVLKLMDGAGYGRDSQWLSGVTVDVPERMKQDVRRAVSQSNGSQIGEILREIEFYGADALSEDEISSLFDARGDDFSRVCRAADEARHEAIGDTVTYVINRNINYTNMCTYHCTFCAFSKGSRKVEGADKPYLIDVAEIVGRSQEAWDKGGTEVCLQGGIHPSFTGETYLSIAEGVRRAIPDMHIHAFSPLEVWHGATSLGVSLDAFLRMLKDVGLNTLPGTAAEILDDRVRAELCPDKLNTDQWLEVIETAHEVGLSTTSTIMFGHLETYESWALHLLRLRELQKRTGGITEFVPLPFVAHEAPVYKKGKARRGPTLREGILMHAVSRLVLAPYIENIQTSWVKMGMQGAQLCLDAGANDMGGTLMNESITRAAGAKHGQEMTEDTLRAAILEIGRTPMQRSTQYGSMAESSHWLTPSYLQADAIQYGFSPSV